MTDAEDTVERDQLRWTQSGVCPVGSKGFVVFYHAVDSESQLQEMDESWENVCDSYLHQQAEDLRSFSVKICVVRDDLDDLTLLVTRKYTMTVGNIHKNAAYLKSHYGLLRVQPEWYPPFQHLGPVMK